MGKRQIRLSEEKLRNFISYSVARLISEGYGFGGFEGRPLYDKYGEYDGSEGSNYGSSDVKISFFEWMEDNLKSLDNIVQTVVREGNGKFNALVQGAKSMYDALSDIFVENDLYTGGDFVLCVDFTRSKGMKGDGHLQPDDSDDVTIQKKVIKQPQANQTLQKIQDPLQREFVQKIISYWPEWIDEDFIYENVISDTLYEERNLGITTHFDGKSSFEPKNPYKDMTWNDYCEAKRREREEENNRPEEEPNRTNRGIMAHFDGKKHEETPEERERAEHMFDDDYWVNKMNLSRDELDEIVRRAVKKIIKEMKTGDRKRR